MSNQDLENLENFDDDLLKIIGNYSSENVASNGLNELDFQGLYKVSECLVEIRSIVRNKDKFDNDEINFIYNALDACHNIPRIIAEKDLKSNDFDWLLQSNINSANLALRNFKDRDSYRFEEISLPKKSKFHFILFGFVGLIFLCCIVFAVSYSKSKNNYSNYNDFETGFNKYYGEQVEIEKEIEKVKQPN